MAQDPAAAALVSESDDVAGRCAILAQLAADLCIQNRAEKFRGIGKWREERPGRKTFQQLKASNSFTHQPRMHQEESDCINLLITLLFHGLQGEFAKDPKNLLSQRRCTDPKVFRKNQMGPRFFQRVVELDGRRPEGAAAFAGAWPSLLTCRVVLTEEIQGMSCGNRSDKRIIYDFFLSDMQREMIVRTVITAYAVAEPQDQDIAQVYAGVARSAMAS